VYQDQAFVNALRFCLKDFGLLTHEYVSKGEELRKEIWSKTHNSSYTVHFESTKMYKDEKRAKLDFSVKRQMVSRSRLTRSWRTCHGLACWTSEVVVPTFHRVRYRRLLEMPPYEALYGRKCQSPWY
jgi:hypothetical protein